MAGIMFFAGGRDITQREQSPRVLNPSPPPRPRFSGKTTLARVAVCGSEMTPLLVREFEIDMYTLPF